MTKQEFLDELRNALSGEVSPEVMMDSYRYYDSYIEEELRKGKSESNILEELGKPSLLARSIIAAHMGEREADVEYTEDGKARNVRRKSSYSKKTAKEAGTVHKEFTFDVNGWCAKILYVLIIILLIMLIFFILKFGIWIFVTFGIPILLIMGIIYLIMYFTR
ncbi:MAG: DUF1700 domain-containing protein [Bacteroidales bacterium]|nr:DUF1700 domain-containing protein [Clostridium sp.]MCM1202837.1 DUF1700 domain-containing protein [Bacteroidales bacterium]